jgi:hypothetical protein
MVTSSYSLQSPASSLFGDPLAAVGVEARMPPGAQHVGPVHRQFQIYNGTKYNEPGNSGAKLQGFFVRVADKVAPVSKPPLNRMATMDFSSWGHRLTFQSAIPN